jgi:hypothetical protein
MEHLYHALLGCRVAVTQFIVKALEMKRLKRSAHAVRRRGDSDEFPSVMTKIVAIIQGRVCLKIFPPSILYYS